MADSNSHGLLQLLGGSSAAAVHMIDHVIVRARAGQAVHVAGHASRQHRRLSWRVPDSPAFHGLLDVNAPFQKDRTAMSASQTVEAEVCVWTDIRAQAERQVAAEPMLASFLHATVLNHECIEDAISFHLSGKLGAVALTPMQLREVMDEAMRCDPGIAAAACADIRAVRERDPAVNCCLVPLLYLKGVHALIAHRVGHWLWNQDRKLLALHLQNRISETFCVDIHPAAQIGRGILMDHATSIVIGETAVVEDNVSLLHEVTLGGTGKVTGDRHPKVRRGVLIGAGAKILGAVEIGAGAKVGAGSVVLNDVAAHCTVAGVPAVVVGHPCTDSPALDMDQKIT
jgi:serine O-acetyltransferase